jgi:hypothetical protein
LSHLGQVLEVALGSFESKLPSALNTRVAASPLPGVAGVPAVGGASKLPPG